MLKIWRRIPARAWEKAFVAQEMPLDHDSFGRVVHEAATRAKVSPEELLDDGADGFNTVSDVLDAHEVGEVGLEFPESTHGDGISVTVSRFPGGTAVGVLFTTWTESSLVFAIPRASLKKVIAAADDAVGDVNDGAEFTYFEEEDDYPEDGTSLAMRYGRAEFEKAWKKAIRRGAGSTQKARAQASRKSGVTAPQSRVRRKRVGKTSQARKRGGSK